MNIKAHESISINVGSNCLQGRRIQYPFSHFFCSTIHKAVGQTLPEVGIQLSDDNDRNLNENVSSPGGGLDLINVAFQQPDGQYDVPDRVTALQAFEELQSIYPSVRLNLVLVNVTKAELQEMREDCIRDLLHPLDTVLDDSIGCAIWFAARYVRKIHYLCSKN